MNSQEKPCLYSQVTENCLHGRFFHPHLSEKYISSAIRHITFQPATAYTDRPDNAAVPLPVQPTHNPSPVLASTAHGHKTANTPAQAVPGGRERLREQRAVGWHSDREPPRGRAGVCPRCKQLGGTDRALHVSWAPLLLWELGEVLRAEGLVPGELHPVAVGGSW